MVDLKGNLSSVMSSQNKILLTCCMIKAGLSRRQWDLFPV